MTGEVVDTGAANPAEVDFVALQPGQTIGRFTVVSVLGQGGFGITYRARDTQLGREVAIKEYLPTAIAIRQGGETVLPRSTKVAADFTWGRERFVAEGQTLASLHHAPGIVRVHDFLEINGTAYIVMELLHGETLEDRIKKQGPLDAAAVDRILTPLLDGLEQVHKAGFLHRDIKPANILLNAKGDPTLIDFGASRAAMAGRSVVMTAVFTPGYAATEQMTSAKQGPWTDIYALSATLYHAIAGKAPPNAFDRMLDDDYEPLGKLAPQGFAPGLIAGIDAGLAVRASDRPQSIAGWRTLLSMASPGDDDATRLAPRTADAGATVVSRTPTQAPTVQPAPSSPASPPPTPGQKSKVPLYAGLAAVGLLLLAGGGWFVLAPKSGLQAPSAQALKTEDLERVLAERRAADAQAADKRRAEEEAQRKADAEATAKRAADAELEQARINRQKAEEELAKLKAEMETRRIAEASQRQQSDAVAQRAAEQAAQRKAEAEMAALRQTEEDARKKVAAEAEAKRAADEALAKAQAERQQADAAARVKAEAEAKQKAEADAKQRAEAEARQKIEAEAKQKADAEAQQKAAADAAALADKKAAETAETALRLSVPDRQRVQVALTSLGFDTRGADGAFGPRSRDMVAAWQKARNQPATGFLSGPQNQALLREAAPALQKYDEEQKKKEEDEKKKAEEARKKAEDEAKARAAAPAPAAAAPAAPAAAPAAQPNVATAAPPGGAVVLDGTYTGSLVVQGPGLDTLLHVSVKMANGGGTGTVSNKCGPEAMKIRVDPSGRVSGELQFPHHICGASFPAKLSGQAEGNKGIRLEVDGTTTSYRGRGKIRLAE